MKKSTIVVIIAVIMVALGIGLTVTGILIGAEREIYIDSSGVHAGGGTIIGGPASNGMIQKTINLEKFHSMDISLASTEVELIPSNEWKVEYRISQSVPLRRCEVKNGVLYIESQNEYMVFNVFTLLTRDTYVKVYYPEGTEFESVKIENVSGNNRLNGAAAKTMRLSSSSGRINADGVKAGQLSASTVSGEISAQNAQVERRAEFDTTSGDVSINGLTAGEIRMGTVSGCLEAISAKAENSFEFDSTSGDAVLDSASLGSFSFDAVSGCCRGDGVKTTAIEFGSTSGDCWLSGELDGNMELSSTSGDITLTTTVPADDYRVEMNSISGSRTINGTTLDGIVSNNGSKSISIGTTSGDISVNFE